MKCPYFGKPINVIGHLLFGVRRFNFPSFFGQRVARRHRSSLVVERFMAEKFFDYSLLFSGSSLVTDPLPQGDNLHDNYNHPGAAMWLQDRHGHSQTSVTPVSFTGGNV